MWPKLFVLVFEPMQNQHVVVDNSFSTREFVILGANEAKLCRIGKQSNRGGFAEGTRESTRQGKNGSIVTGCKNGPLVKAGRQRIGQS